MKHIKSIPVFDKKTMALFSDGTLYQIDNVRANFTDEEDLPKKAIEKFAKVVQQFKSPHKLCLVYNEQYGYYHVSILGFTDKTIKWDDDLNTLNDSFLEYLTQNKISFT